MTDNYCCGGYCSKGKNSKEVKECQDSLPEGWNRQCAFQNGEQVKDEQLTIKQTCCSSGCLMNRWEVAQWNGLCAFQG
jgi:hypothetical protein